MVALGITGHRFLAEMRRIEVGIDEVARQLGNSYGDEDWTVVSALAVLVRAAEGRGH